MPDIKKKIRECGFTTQQIAEKLNISQQAVSQAINGNPSLSRLEQIASAIGITVSELVADNQDEPEYDPPRWGETGTTSKEPQQKCPYCGHDLNIKVE